MTNLVSLVSVLNKRNLSIRTLEWKWKRDVTPVPSESLVSPISDRGS